MGTASATDPNGDTLTYSIIGGNEDGKFAVNSTNGEITRCGIIGTTRPSFHTRSRWKSTTGEAARPRRQ